MFKVNDKSTRTTSSIPPDFTLQIQEVQLDCWMLLQAITLQSMTTLKNIIAAKKSDSWFIIFYPGLLPEITFNYL